ncbi:MAG: 30S ribosomal protein S18 [Patescibacteria group bacterium]
MPKRRCLVCKTKNMEIDYKDVAALSRYLDRWNKIQPASRTNNCAGHQRAVENAVKKARFLALLPYTVR